MKCYLLVDQTVDTQQPIPRFPLSMRFFGFQFVRLTSILDMQFRKNCWRLYQKTIGCSHSLNTIPVIRFFIHRPAF